MNKKLDEASTSVSRQDVEVAPLQVSKRQAAEEGMKMIFTPEDKGRLLLPPDGIERAQRLLTEISRLWLRGVPIFRKAAQFREETARGFSALPPVGWFSELLGFPEFRRLAAQRGGSDLQSTLMVWVMLKLREVSDTSNWFRPSEALVYKLLATDLHGAVCGDLKPPLSAFYIEMPADLFYLKDRRTGWHEVRALTVAQGAITERTIEVASANDDPGAEGVELGPRLFVECYAEPNASSRDPFDDSWLFMSYRMLGDQVPVDDVIRTSIRDEKREAELHQGRLGDRILNGIEVREFLFKFVLNLCVYLGSERAHVKHVHADEIARLTKGKKPKQLRKNVKERLRRLREERIFDVGSDVVVDAELREYVRTEGTGGFRLTYRTLVRGHWRNQAHGPGYTLRTRRWIEPHVRGAELPTKVVGHNYEVK